MITVCGRSRDPKSKSVPKYENGHGVVIQTMPVREIKPDVSKLTPVGAFIYEKMSGCYLGGFLTRPNTVIVRGMKGSQYTLDVQKMGVEKALNMYKVYGVDESERASCEWLFSVIEPHQSDEDYLNTEAGRISCLAGTCGQVVCRRVVEGSGFGLNAKTKEFVYNL